MIFSHDIKHLPSLRAISALEASARLGSFTAAAQELNVTQGAVSRQIQELERLLGTNLFIRSGPNLTLTEVGTDFSQNSARALDILREAVFETQKKRDVTHVTLSMLPSVAAKWLASRLGLFINQYPDIDLRISATRNLVNFEAESINASIRYGRGKWAGLDAILLARETISPVCTPAYAEKIKLASPSDLTRATLFHTDIEENWAAWFHAAGYSKVQIPRGLQLGDDAATLQATIDGQGIALGRSVLVADDIAMGRLIHPFKTTLKASFSYWFVTPTGSELTSDLLDVRFWIQSEFGTEDKSGT
ncbi:MAG: transcriptional regulator GcvA [Halopseudomonas aestusnigri]